MDRDDDLTPSARHLVRAVAAEAERDAMMIDLARIVALCGWDCDGNDPETVAGAVHLYGDAVQAVRELRQEADDEAELEILRRAERDEARSEVARLRALLPTAGPTWGEHCAGLALLGEGSEPTDLRAPGAFPAEE